MTARANSCTLMLVLTEDGTSREVQRWISACQSSPGPHPTIIFGVSALPMLLKAWRTRDLASYSRGNIVMANTGNIMHSVCVFSLPPGPIWLLHTFYLITTAMMLFWYLRFEGRPRFSIRTPRLRARRVAHAASRS